MEKKKQEVRKRTKANEKQVLRKSTLTCSHLRCIILMNGLATGVL